MKSTTTYYCYDCAPAHAPSGTSIAASNLTRSVEQLKSFIRHTVPTRPYQINSVFDDPGFQKYSQYIVNSAASGCLEIDHRGRHNYVWIAGETVGATYSNGSFVTSCDAVKLVLPYDDQRVHAYPTASGDLSSRTCADCGRPVAR